MPSRRHNTISHGFPDYLRRSKRPVYRLRDRRHDYTWPAITVISMQGKRPDVHAPDPTYLRPTPRRSQSTPTGPPVQAPRQCHPALSRLPRLRV